MLCAVLGAALTARSQPTAPPATPTVSSANVDAVYNSSGTYTDIAGVNYFESWGGWASAGNYSIPPVVLGYHNVQYGGIDLNAQYNFSSYSYLHIDVYTPTGTSFAIRLVSATGQADVNYPVSSGVIVPGTWVHLDIPLSQFTGLNLTTIHQLGLINNDGGDSGSPDYYLDNIFFYNPPPTPVSVTITSPGNGASVGNYFTINASASVYPGTVTNVNFYADGTLLGKSTSSPFSYFTASGVTAGAHTLTAIAYASGGTTATNSVAVTVTNNPPLVVYEPFNYASIGNGTAANGTGESGTWSVAAATHIASGSLTYPGITPTNNSLDVNSARTSVHFAYPIARSGTKWISYLVDMNGNCGGTPSGVYFANGGTGLWFGQGLIGVSGSTGPLFISTTDTTSTGGPQPNGILSPYFTYNFGQTYLVVLQIQFNTGAGTDTVIAYINPVAGTNTPTGYAGALTNTTINVGAISGFGVQNAGCGDNFVDELRIGDTFGSVVGAAAPTIPTTLALSVAAGKEVSWSAVSGDYYQVQSSPNNSTWTDFGSQLTGTAVTSVFDPAAAAYYQVLQDTPVTTEEVQQGDFEGADYSWTAAGSMPPTQDTGDAHTGTACESLYVTNAAAMAQVSLLQQNVYDVGGAQIVPGNTYTFSFWAKALPKTGFSYVQQYYPVWLDGNGAILGALTPTTWPGFTANSSTWTQTSLAPAVAPAGAVTVLIQIQAVTGAVLGDSGGVLIDDVSLNTISPSGSPSVIPSTVQAGGIFTAVVKTNGVTAGNATGTVLFETNTVSQSTGTVSTGSANSTATALPSAYVLKAIYSGDGVYIGSTNTLVVSGSNFGTAPGSVSLSGGNSTVVMSGVAGNHYSLQRATNATFTAGISNFPAILAPAGGNVTNVDNFSDLGGVPAEAFYRLQYLP